ncbi:hypothetical protein FB45DRAFT_523419 [Roridomyces roridus]|uniref:F-box domain-containing protein n=1 Tax=Roridomyces roridus TaxID=1738132 RepID=A0AAD7BXS8_9AGAR|nr:hypothetical protein FB45DRAFT_523419 [Roridomyces roridus]
MASTLAAARERISQLDIEIEKLQRLMDPFLAERKKCQQVLADYTYPILTLPTEITSEIFLQFLPSYPHRPNAIGSQSPSLLLQICRQWHDVALTTPALWSTLELLLDYGGSHAQQRDLLDVWLRRSATCPLSIRLDCSEELADDDDEGPSIVFGFVDSLLCHAMRWQDMEFVLPFECLRKIAGSMPLLRRVTIGIANGPVSPETPAVLFTDAPVLNHVVLDGSFNPFAVQLPWSQITTLTAEALYANEAFEILLHGTMLQDCTLRLLNGEPWTDSSVPPLPLRSLRLENLGGGTDQLRRFFKALHLPLLQTLAVHEFFLGPDPIAALSGVCPERYPREIEIFCAHASRGIYAGAFPLASLSIHKF